MTQETEQRQTSCGGGCMPGKHPESLGIPVRINGRGPFLMSVDTGAGLTVVPPEVAEELGLEKVGEEERRGAGGPVTIELFSVDSVEAAGVAVKLNTIGADTFIKKLCGESFQGNLGYDILKHGQLIADFAGERMVFGPSSDTPIGGVPFEIASKKQPLVVVETKVNGKGPYRFAVDTGAMGTCIAPKLADELGAEKGQAIQAAGVGGMLEAYFTAAPLEFNIGDRYTNQVAPVVLDIFGARSDGKCVDLSGIIGQDIMREYIVTFDYPRNIIQFT